MVITKGYRNWRDARHTESGKDAVTRDRKKRGKKQQKKE